MLSCPICNAKFQNILANHEPQKYLQNHLWGAHDVEVVKSHDIAKRFLAGKLGEQEILELKQMKLGL